MTKNNIVEEEILSTVSEETENLDVYWVTIKIPRSKGHFWATFTLPSNLEDALVGPFGGYAYKMYNHTEDHATYAYESFGELFSDDIYPDIQNSLGRGRYRQVKVPFIPKLTDEKLPDFVASPAIGSPEEVKDLIPKNFGFNQHNMSFKGITLLSESKAHRSFGLRWLGPTHAAVAEFTIFARSPVVRVSGIARRLDMRSSRDSMFIEMAEEIQFVNTEGREELGFDSYQDDFQGDWVGTGTAVFDTGSLFPFRFQILAQKDSKPDSDGEIDTFLQDIHKHSIEAARDARGFFRGMPVTWPGKWFGEEVITHYSKPHSSYVNLYEIGSNFGFLDRRHWASELGAGQGGSQNSFGPIFTSPVFSNPSPRVIDFLEYCVEDWALRPVHVFEPGSVMTPISLSRSEVTTNNRQIHYASKDLVYPDFRPEGKSEIMQRTGHDEQHYADAPLQTAYALTADYGMRVVMQSNMHMDLHQRRVKSGWSNNGRGTGRTMMGMVNNAICLPEYREVVYSHIQEMTVNLGNNWAGKDMPEENPVRVIAPITDGRLQCKQPAWGPWEEAQAAYGFMRAYEMYGDKSFLHWAFILGRANNHAAWEELGKWWKPYRLYADPEGKSLQEKLSISSELTHFGGVWIWWCLIADKVFLRANSILQEATEEELDRSRKVLDFMRVQDPADFVDAHMSLESRPTPFLPKPQF